jgi:hypothetical protein
MAYGGYNMEQEKKSIQDHSYFSWFMRQNGDFILTIMLVVLGWFFLVWYGEQVKNPTLKKEERIPICAVYMHREMDYSVSFSGENKELITRNVLEVSKDWAFRNDFVKKNNSTQNYSSLKIFQDVPQGENKYLLLKGLGVDVAVEIHINTHEDISGADWTTGGKNPTKSRTVPIR